MTEATTTTTTTGDGTETDTGTGTGGNGDGTTPGTGTETPQTPEALQAEVEKWKAQSRKHEDRAKANADAVKELERLKQSTMSDTERAVDEARSAARAEALREAGGKLAAAELRAQAAGRIADQQLATLLDGVDLARFLTDDGDVDVDKVTKFIDGIAPKNEDGTTTTGSTTTRPRGDLGQGARGTGMALNGDPILESVKQKLGIS